jgi:hypothetical protein
MKSNSTDFRWGIVLAALMLVASAAAQGQSAPPLPQSQAQQILNRLDRLEKDNQALLEEIRALRQELSVLKPAASGAASAVLAQTDAESVAQQQQAADERQAVEENRVAELAQTKVEASQKYPIRITGMALFNASVNGRYNGNAENPLVASLTPGDETGGGTLRQSTLGLLFNGPQTFLGGQISGSVYMDFFGGSTSSLNHLVRLRTAAINVDWKNTSILVGQDKPIISPRDPDSLAQVGYSPLTGSGNLWLWQPQVRLEQRFSLGDNTGIRAQAGVFVTSTLDYPMPPTAYGIAPPREEYSRPGIEDRIQLWHSWGETERFEIAAGYHFNENRVNETVFPTEVYSLDWFVRPVSKLEFSGMFFHGQNVATLGGLPQGFVVTPSGSVIAVHSTGGWAQIRVPITARLAFDVYGGQQDDRNADLGYGYIGKNQGYFSNLMYRLAPNVIVSLEGGQVRTNYIGLGNRVNDHYDLAVAYLF